MKKTLSAIALAMASLGAHAIEYKSIVTAQSEIGFAYKQMGVAMDGRFKSLGGSIQLDPAKLAQAKVSIDVALASFDTGTEADQEVGGKSWFNTQAFPKATFKSTRVVFEGDKPKAIEGQLTIKGVTKPVTLTVTSFQAMPHPMLKKPAIGANAFTVIKRSEFNAGKYAPYVGDDVRIDIAIEAIAP